MSGIISGRARVVFSSAEFLHLSKGGLDGKIVAYRDSWISKSFDMQDWVTFKAKAHEPEGAHGSYGVRYKALPNSVKFESKGKIIDGVGTLLKVDENQGQYGFIKANDGSTVYFTASVVRPETKDIRSVFRTGVQIRYRATEQKQNAVQWRAIAVCSRNMSIDSLTGRQPKNDVNNTNRTVIGLAPKKPLQPTAVSNTPSAQPHINKLAPTNSISIPTTQVSSGTTNAGLINGSNNNGVSSVSAALRASPASACAMAKTLESRSSSQASRGEATCAAAPPGARPASPSPADPSSAAPSPFPPVVFPTSHPPDISSIPFHEVPSTGDAYEDAVRRLAYFAHCVSDSWCNYCLLR